MKDMSNSRSLSEKRFSVSIPQEIEGDIAELKKTQYFDRSRSEMIRYLIKKGLDAVRREQVDGNTDRPA